MIEITQELPTDYMFTRWTLNVFYIDFLFYEKKTNKSILTYHDKPRGPGCILDAFQRVSVNIWLHFKVEQKTFVDDIG